MIQIERGSIGMEEKEKIEEAPKEKKKVDKPKNLKSELAILAVFLVAGFLAEAYVMTMDTVISGVDNMIIIGGIAVVILFITYLFINKLVMVISENETKNEQYERIFKAETATYIALKKNFQQLEERMEVLESKLHLPSKEIINAQKATSTVIIKRSRENAEAIINSNIQTIEKLEEMDRKQKAIDKTQKQIELTQQEIFLGVKELQNNEMPVEYESVEAKLYDLTLQIKNLRKELGNVIMQNPELIVADMHSHNH